MSANTGTAFQTKIEVAHADIVQVGTIISSPGEISKAPTEQIRPDVQEFTAIVCLTLKNFSQSFSNF